jgi:hypothetical protein
MPESKPSLMKNSTDDDTASIQFIEDDVLIPFDAPEASIQLIAFTPNARLLSNFGSTAGS